MISLSRAQAEAIHARVAEGRLRDPGRLEAALARPLAGVGETRFYADVAHAAAALCAGLAEAQAFTDGNKRLAFAAAAILLRAHGLRERACAPGEAWDYFSTLGRRSIDEVAAWLVAPGSGSSRVSTPV